MEVVQVPERSRFELRDGSELLGLIDYVRRGDVLDLHHTEILPARRGSGLGAVLVGGALDQLQAEGARIVPSCWFVAEFVDAHPEYAALVEG